MLPQLQYKWHVATTKGFPGGPKERSEECKAGQVLSFKTADAVGSGAETAMSLFGSLTKVLIPHALSGSRVVFDVGRSFRVSLFRLCTVAFFLLISELCVL